MVDKKGLKVVKRNEIILIILALIFVGYVFAADPVTTLSDPPRGGNYSGTMLLNCSTNLNSSVPVVNSAALNFTATYYYNASGGPTPNFSFASADYGANSGNLTANVTNQTSDGTYWYFNITIDTTWLSDGRYNISCFVTNGSGGAPAQVWNHTSSVNITIDNTPPNVTFIATNISNYGNYTSANVFVLNVSAYDAIIGMNDTSDGFGTNSGNVYFNVTNSSGGRAPMDNWTRATNVSQLSGFAGAYFNGTLNTTNFPDGKYNITIWANDSAYLNSTNQTDTWVHSNLNNSEYIQITIDDTAPSSVTLTAGTGGTKTQNVITITAVDDTSGIDNCVIGGGSGITITGRGTGTQTLTHTGLSCGTSYSYIVSCQDFVGHSLSSLSKSFSTSSCSSGDSPSGGAPSIVTAIEKVNVLNIDPESEATLSNFEEDMGVKEIKISVTEEASNVKVTVKKFDTEPAEITVSKTGNVHRYLQIETENLADKMSQAIITIRVQRNWLSDNNISKANIALFKLDESAGKWNELLTVYKSEDDDYYYYDSEVTSFSYFAIAEKGIEEPGEPEEPESNLLWLWIVIGVVVLAVIVGGGIAAKKRR
ncbi:PGF-pre-PGF domain-containing protein [Candidatus Pacearchaeota archaeon]|nr:PGF-pre-PGF domain-containing protein [Candidatus Pacearchaeota archaeon]